MSRFNGAFLTVDNCQLLLWDISPHATAPVASPRNVSSRLSSPRLSDRKKHVLMDPIMVYSALSEITNLVWFPQITPMTMNSMPAGICPYVPSPTPLCGIPRCGAPKSHTSLHGTLLSPTPLVRCKVEEAIANRQTDRSPSLKKLKKVILAIDSRSRIVLTF